MDLKSFVGQKAGPYRIELSQERIESFAKAVCATGQSGAAVPTVVTVCREGEFDLVSRMGINLAQVLHAEQEYTLEDFVQAGDVLIYETEVSQVMEKRGSTAILNFIVLETVISAERKAKSVSIAKSRTSFVVKEGVIHGA